MILCLNKFKIIISYITMFYIVSVFDNCIEIKSDADSFDSAKISLEEIAKNHVRDMSGAERALSPFRDIGCNKDTLEDGAYLVQVSENQIDVYNKKTNIVRGWISNSVDYKIQALGSYKILKYESSKPEVKETPSNIIKVQMCENCSNRVKNEPVIYKKIQRDDGALTSLIDELKENCKFLMRRRNLVYN